MRVPKKREKRRINFNYFTILPYSTGRPSESESLKVINFELTFERNRIWLIRSGPRHFEQGYFKESTLALWEFQNLVF